MPDPIQSDPGKALEILALPAVQKHLDILQSIVNRLAQNSSTCKNWCITLVAGVLLLAFSKDTQDGIKHAAPWLACIPITIFWAIDAYYHSLERVFRRQFSALVASVHQGTFVASQVLMIGDTRNRYERFEDTLIVAFTTAATGGFYAALVIAVILIRCLLS